MRGSGGGRKRGQKGGEMTFINIFPTHLSRVDGKRRHYLGCKGRGFGKRSKSIVPGYSATCSQMLSLFFAFYLYVFAILTVTKVLRVTLHPSHFLNWDNICSWYCELLIIILCTFK